LIMDHPWRGKILLWRTEVSNWELESSEVLSTTC
jgi:hypothetical protein